MEQIKTLILSEESQVRESLRCYLSDWGIQTLEIDRSPNFSDVKAFSPQLIFIEKKLYCHCNYLWERTFDLMGSEMVPGIIILVHSTEDMPSVTESEYYDILSIPYSQASLFRTIRQALCLRENDFAKTSVFKQLAQIDDHLEKLFGQVARIRGGEGLAKMGTKPISEGNAALNQRNEVICRMRPLVMSLLKDAKREGPLHPYETQLLLIDQCISELELDPSMQNSQHLSITELLKSHPLSRKELKIVSMIASGMTTEEIADGLYISYDTVKSHRRNIRKKLHLVGNKYSLGDFIHQLTALNSDENCVVSGR